MNSFIFDGVSIQNKRKTNMDSLMVHEKTMVETQMCLAVICDGVGSMANGAFASAWTVRMLREWFDTLTDATRAGIRMRDKIMEIDHRISACAEEMEIRTGTTVSALLLDSEKYYVVHAGDSRIYAVGNGGLERLTFDQISNGRLTSCLGRGNGASLFYNEGPCVGKRFLLCSDGLYKRTEEIVLEKELAAVNRRSCKKAVHRLAQYAVERGEKDNISLAIVICES